MADEELERERTVAIVRGCFRQERQVSRLCHSGCDVPFEECDRALHALCRTIVEQIRWIPVDDWR